MFSVRTVDDEVNWKIKDYIIHFIVTITFIIPLFLIQFFINLKKFSKKRFKKDLFENRLCQVCSSSYKGTECINDYCIKIIEDAKRRRLN
jgi:hypothetical protein